MLSATFGDEIVGYEQRDSTGCDVNRRVGFLGSGSGLLGLGIDSGLSELTLRRLLLLLLLTLLGSLIEQQTRTHLN